MIRPLRTKENGFTLMEVITAVFVFLVGIVGVISLFAAAAVFHKGARDKTIVSLAVQQVISDIELDLKLNPLRDSKGDLKRMEDRPVQGFDQFVYDVEFKEHGISGPSLVTAHVKLAWMEKGKKRGEDFDYVFRPGPRVGAVVDEFLKDKNRSSVFKVSEEGD